MCPHEAECIVFHSDKIAIIIIFFRDDWITEVGLVTSERRLLSLWYAGVSGCVFYFYFLLWLKRSHSHCVIHVLGYTFCWFVLVETAGERPSTDTDTSKDSLQIQEPQWRRIKCADAHRDRRDSSIQTPSSLPSISRSRPRGQPVSQPPAPVESYPKTLFQHGELTKLKSNLYYGKSHFARRQK